MAEGCLSVDDSVLIKVSVGYWKLFLYLSVVLSFFFLFFFLQLLCSDPQFDLSDILYTG